MLAMLMMTYVGFGLYGAVNSHSGIIGSAGGRCRSMMVLPFKV